MHPLAHFQAMGRTYEIEAGATFMARLDEGVIQDLMLAVSMAMKTYGAQDVRVECREAHFIDD